MSYTPTTWTTGDTITATAMNKIENGIANAGGALSEYTYTSGTLNGSYNDLKADFLAGKTVYCTSTDNNDEEYNILTVLYFDGENYFANFGSVAFTQSSPTGNMHID